MCPHHIENCLCQAPAPETPVLVGVVDSDEEVTAFMDEADLDLLITSVEPQISWGYPAKHTGRLQIFTTEEDAPRAAEIFAALSLRV